MNQESGQTTQVAVGKFKIRMVPPEPQTESPDRISFWWGLTSSSLALARFIESELPLTGREVLELGSGVGLPGLVASMLGARVTFTDYVPEALETVKSNAEINGALKDTMRFACLDWEFPVDIGRFDFIIGSEIVYEYFFHGHLTEIICKALKSHGTLIIADRKRMVVDRFMGRLQRKGFMCNKKTCFINEDEFPAQAITIYVLRKA